jgi:hypothetical protein
MQSFFKNPVILCAITVVIALAVFMLSKHKSNFKNTLITPMSQLNYRQPRSFPKLTEKTQQIHLAPPVNREEIGLAMVYPQGSGVGMSTKDSNSFYPFNPGPLLTDHTTPESYGSSSLADPLGNSGSAESARILRIKNAGSQSLFKPLDESINTIFSPAYNAGYKQDGSTFINNNAPINYESDFNPERNLKLQASPGHSSTLPNCESTYPNVVKYKGMCITEGDIPYGQMVNNKVNPRLVSRWESFTGDYNRNLALGQIDGTLYPNLNVLVQ